MVRTNKNYWLVQAQCNVLEKVWVPKEGREKFSQSHCGSLIGKREEGVEGSENL